MKSYELTYLISSELNEEKLKQILQKISDFVTEEKGAPGEIKNPIKKRLRCKIERKKTMEDVSTPSSPPTSIYLAILNFYLEPDNLPALEEKLKSEHEILRYIILVRKKLKKAPKLSRGKTPSLSEDLSSGTKPLTDEEKIVEKKTDDKPEKSEDKLVNKKTKVQEKVELDEIDKKLEEIIGK